MQVVLYLIILSLVVAVGFLISFFWAVKSGQYEDDYTPAMRILIDDDMVQPNNQQDNFESKPTKYLNNNSNGEVRDI